MEFVEWCGAVLDKISELTDTSLDVRSMGVYEFGLLQAVFGEDVAAQPGFLGSKRHEATLDAASELQIIGLLEGDAHGGRHWRPSKLAEDLRGDLVPVWESICQIRLKPDQEQLLRVVNRLSPHDEGDCCWLEWVEHASILPELAWDDGMNHLWPVSRELERLGLINVMATAGPHLRMHAMYRGLVWEKKRGFTLESRFIDDLVAEWETTSVDFKRELHLDTADEKAEFVKDVLGLANTQASGRRWLIVGFHPKTHEYFGAPGSDLKQDRIEQILAQYTEPVVNVRYEVVEYRFGPVGKLEVLRERHKLPYVAAKSMGDKRRIERGQVFVRHGSQTETPSSAELEAIQEEGDISRRQSRDVF